MWVYDNRKIAINYLTSWFPLDLLTGIPFGGAAAGLGAAGAAEAAERSGSSINIRVVEWHEYWHEATLCQRCFCTLPPV